jgi:hypothetical protein
MSFEPGEGSSRKLTVSYIGRCILSVVRDNSDVTASSLIESILMFAGYRVKYSKAWQLSNMQLSCFGAIGKSHMQKFQGS